MTQAIRIRDLEKSFRTGLRRRRSPAVRGLSLEVGTGEVFGFLGPNGAGKTTTIKILMGLLKPDAGEACLFDQPVGAVASRRRVAYLPELPDFYDYLRPGEFLAHCGRLSGVAEATLRRRIPELLERVGLDPAERRALRKFSKGMLQRVGIASTMIADPELFILDEPMGGLDPLGRRWVKDWIAELARAGKTVFFSSHVLAEAEAVCHRAAFLFRGRLVGQGSLAELLQGGGGGFEIGVTGSAALTDPALAGRLLERRPAGTDSLLLLGPEAPLEPLLALLAERGYRLQSVNRRHASLEDVFIRLADGQAGR